MLSIPLRTRRTPARWDRNVTNVRLRMDRDPQNGAGPEFATSVPSVSP